MLRSSQKPRFSLELSLNELSNIPHVGGSCFIDIAIRDSKKAKFSFGSSNNPSSIAQAAIENSKAASKLKQLTSTSSPTNSSSKTTNGSSHSSSSPGSVNAVTSKKRIHNFKCNFNYKISCNLKFPIKKKENLIGNKYLVMTVYYAHDRHVANHSDDSSSNELGKVEVNLSEYLNFTGAATSKYLLKESKVNSILSVTISLRELSSNVDFHTQLQISDSITHSSSVASGTQAYTNSTISRDGSTAGRFNVPNFERNKVFGGLNDVIHQDNGNSSDGNGTDKEKEKDKEKDNDKEKDKNCSIKELTAHFTNHKMNLNPHKPGGNGVNGGTGISSGGPSGGAGSFLGNNTKDNTVLMEPIISNLYKKILEASWDPELYKLLNYSPEKIVEQIFVEGKGWNENLSKIFGKWDDGEEDGIDSIRGINGLINEVPYREELKSWNSQT